MKLSSFKTLLFVVMAALVVLPVMACAPKAPPPPPPPPPAPPAGTISVEPAKIDQAMLKKILPAFAKAVGLPEAAVPTLPPALAVLAVPIKFSGSGWQADEIITVELVVPPDVEMKGLDRERGEDAVGIALATADAEGNFEASMGSIGKVNWLLRGEWLPIIKPDLTKINPLPNGVYTIKAVGTDPRTVATTTWELELLPTEKPAEKPAEKPPAAPGKLSFEAAEYTNEEYGFSVKYPKEWAEQSSETLLFYAAAPARVPVLFVDAEAGADLTEALKASLEAAGASGFKVVSTGEVTLADGSPASKVVFKATLRGFAGEGYAVGVKKDDKWVMVMVATVALLAPYDEAKFSEIAHTLQFK